MDITGDTRRRVGEVLWNWVLTQPANVEYIWYYTDMEKEYFLPVLLDSIEKTGPFNWPFESYEAWRQNNLLPWK